MHGSTHQRAWTAEILQIQLGKAYQDNQHLRDAILRELSNESFVQEVYATTIKVLEDQLCTAKTAAFAIKIGREKRPSPNSNNNKYTLGLRYPSYVQNNERNKCISLNMVLVL